MRGWIRGLVMASAVAGMALAAAGCSHLHHLAAKVSCGSQVVSWYHNGGKADSLALGAALKNVGAADTRIGRDVRRHAGHVPATDLSQARARASALYRAIGKLRADQAPACVPGIRADYSAALADLAKSAADQYVMVIAVRQRNPAALNVATNHFVRFVKAGGKNLDAALAAVKNYAVS